MAHVELSLSDERGPGQSDPYGPSSVRHWAGAAAAAGEPCVVLDADGVIVSLSASCLALLGGHDGGPDPRDGEGWIGRGLLDVLRLVDLTADGPPLAAWESERIPPLLALASGSLARGVMRIRLGDATRTLDAVSTPLRDGSTVAGSLTFLSRI